jgi:hypothetical protein
VRGREVATRPELIILRGFFVKGKFIFRTPFLQSLSFHAFHNDRTQAALLARHIPFSKITERCAWFSFYWRSLRRHFLMARTANGHPHHLRKRMAGLSVSVLL